MIMPRVGKAAIALVALLVVGVPVVACGGGGGDSGGNTEAVDSSGGPGFADGASAPSDRSGTLTVDGQDFKFKVFFCGFTPGETGKGNVPFSLLGNGVSSEGRTFTLVASIEELSSSAMHSVSMSYDDSKTIVVYQNSTAALTAGTEAGQVIDPSTPQLVITGKQISYEGEFSGVNGPIGVGTLKASCP